MTDSDSLIPKCSLEFSARLRGQVLFLSEPKIGVKSTLRNETDFKSVCCFWHEWADKGMKRFSTVMKK